VRARHDEDLVERDCHVDLEPVLGVNPISPLIGLLRGAKPGLSRLERPKRNPRSIAAR
jgi:hypothetical protein